jgi:hypothetical protein
MLIRARCLTPHVVSVVLCICISVYWWCLNSVDLFMKVVLGSRVVYPTRQWYMKEIIFCSIGCGLPLLISALCLAYNMTGGSGLGVGFLSVHTTTDPNASEMETILDWPIFYLPVVLCCAVGIVCWSATMWTFIRSTQSTASSASGAGGNRGLSHYSRAIVFLVVCFAVFAITFSFRGYAEANSTIWSDSAAEWVTCLIVQRPLALSQGGEFDCGDRPKEAPNEGPWMLFQAAISGLGCISFIVYGTTRDNLLLSGIAEKLLQIAPWLTCLEACRARNTAQRSQISGVALTQTDHSRGGCSQKRLSVAGAHGVGSRRPSTSAHGFRAPMPSSRRPSISIGASANRIAPAGRKPGTTPSATPSPGQSRRGSLSQDMPPIAIEEGLDGAPAAHDTLGAGGRPRTRSVSRKDDARDRREAAEARIRRFVTAGAATGAAADEDEDAVHPGLSIRVSIPKPLPPDSVFAPKLDRLEGPGP